MRHSKAKRTTTDTRIDWRDLPPVMRDAIAYVREEEQGEHSALGHAFDQLRANVRGSMGAGDAETILDLIDREEQRQHRNTGNRARTAIIRAIADCIDL